MSRILVGFSTKKSDWLSRLICWATGWRHSHVVLINQEQTRLIEATSFPFQDPEDGEMRDGVREAVEEALSAQTISRLRDELYSATLAAEVIERAKAAARRRDEEEVLLLMLMM